MNLNSDIRIYIDNRQIKDRKIQFLKRCQWVFCKIDYYHFRFLIKKSQLHGDSKHKIPGF